MILKHPCWIYNKSLPKNICNNIIDFALQKNNIKPGTTGGKNLTKNRNSNIVWNNEPWIKRLVMNYILDANKSAGWNFKIDNSEDIQFTIYGPDQYYDWHVDSWEKPYKESGKIRKLSISILLNYEFEGGEFLLNNRNHELVNNIIPINQSKDAGTVIVFPSHILHKVNRVTRSKRI